MSGGCGHTGAVKTVDVRLHPDAESGHEEHERLTRRLRAELAELDVESVEWGAGERPPTGAKGVDLVTVGAIVIALSSSDGALTSVIATLRDWLNRHAARHRISVTIDGDNIVLEKTTAEQRQQLVEAYVRRHLGE
jgi:hypothetical protein